MIKLRILLTMVILSVYSYGVSENVYWYQHIKNHKCKHQHSHIDTVKGIYDWGSEDIIPLTVCYTSIVHDKDIEVNIERVNDILYFRYVASKDIVILQPLRIRVLKNGKVYTKDKLHLKKGDKVTYVIISKDKRKRRWTF